jgi:hypothetical protein
MIVLRPTSLHWINESADDPADLCAHSPIEFRIDGDALVQPSDGVWTVSAAALYLLRTLSQPHTKAQRITEYLFPCCGNGIFDVEGQDDVLILGCNSGIDFEVVQVENEVYIRPQSGIAHSVSVSDWSRAVCEFSDAVHAFYTASSPKVPADDFEQRSYRKFLSEWSRRRSLAEDGLAG